MVAKEKIKKIAILIIGVYLAMFIIVNGANLIGGVIFPPSEANIGDEVVIDIGRNNFLVATFKDYTKVSESDINNGNFHGKNTTIVDTSGAKGSVITWTETTPTTPSENIEYGPTHTDSKIDGIYFKQYNPKDKTTYGILVESSLSKITQSKLIHDVLGFSNSDLGISTSSSNSNSYHVKNDPYTIAKNDPDWYYDHYDYGDNDKIDEYLESQGYD